MTLLPKLVMTPYTSGLAVEEVFCAMTELKTLAVGCCTASPPPKPLPVAPGVLGEPAVPILTDSAACAAAGRIERDEA